MIKGENVLIQGKVRKTMMFHHFEFRASFEFRISCFGFLTNQAFIGDNPASGAFFGGG